METEPNKWVAEKLKDLGLPDSELIYFCDLHKELCKSCDPWEAAKSIVESERVRKSTMRQFQQGHPRSPQNVPEPTPLLLAFLEHAKGFLSPQGVYPMPFLYMDTEGRMACESIAAQPEEVFNRVKQTLGSKDIAEFAFGMDRYARPGQGFPDDIKEFLSLTWFLEGRFYTGVIPYHAGDQPRMLPVDWGNTVWNRALMCEAEALKSTLRGRT